MDFALSTIRQRKNRWTKVAEKFFFSEKNFAHHGSESGSAVMDVITLPVLNPD